jgi:hypothetical protein
VSDGLSVVGSVCGCTVRVTPTDTDYVQITAEYEGDEAKTMSVPKNRWVERSGIREYATDIATQLNIDDEIVHEVLKDLRVKAFLLWNWKTFTRAGSTTAPSFDHLKSLTVPGPHVGGYPTTVIRL